VAYVGAWLALVSSLSVPFCSYKEMLWIALGSSALVAALYFGVYKFFNHTCSEGESSDEWDARPSRRLSATLDERFARF